MTQVTAQPETPTQPAAVALPPSPFLPCDGHVEPNTQALFEIVLPSGGTLHLCKHHTRKHFGVNENTWLDDENKKQGSAS